MAPRVGGALALLVAGASAQCHNNCNQKGLCNSRSICECFTGYAGPDCADRSCPSGRAWSDMPNATDSAHAYAECSNRGYCNRKTGFCDCDALFGGFACDRLQCATMYSEAEPDEFGEQPECSGHGRCMSVAEAAESFDGFHLNRSAHRKDPQGVPYDLWDADMIYGCVCDPGFESFDCSKLTCDVGDDRRTVGQRDEVATLFCKCEAPCNGRLAVSFMGDESTISPAATADDLRIKLEGMRYLHAEAGLLYPKPIAVTSGGTTDGAICSQGGQRSVIEFLRDAGDLPPLWVDDAELLSDMGRGYAYMETNMTLNCSCAACSGSFTLTYDGEATGGLSYDASPGDVEAALLRLSNLQEGDVRAVHWGGNAGAGLCVGENILVTFTMPSGNQPPLVATSSLLESGAPGGAIDVRSNDGTKERDLCNAAGFCDRDGLVTLDIEATDPKLVNGTCACDEGFVFDQDFGSCGRPAYNTSAWTGLQRCPGYVTKDTAREPAAPLNWRWLYVADGMNLTELVELENNPVVVSSANESGSGDVKLPGAYQVGPLEPNEEDVPETTQLWNMTNSSVAGVALDLSWRELYYVDRDLGGIRVAKLRNYSDQLTIQENRFENTIVVQGLGNTIDGITLNLLFGERTLYVADPGRDGHKDGKIYMVSLEDRGGAYGETYLYANVTNLTTVIGSQVALVDPQGLALDLLNRKLYWTDSGNSSVEDGKVYMSNLDGSDAVCALERGLWDPMGIVLDLRNYTMILTDESAGHNGHGAIIKANMAYGPEIWKQKPNDIAYYANRTWWQVILEEYETLTVGGVDTLHKPYGIVLDTTNDMLYISDSESGHIIKCDVNGSLGSVVPMTFMDQGVPMGMALDNGLGPSQDRGAYECYGHGRCGGPEANFKCACDEGWYGNCNMSTCPLGRAFFDQPWTRDEGHALVPCSGNGYCDASTGACDCRDGFEGGNCERLSCPVGANGETCSGHGECLTMRMLGAFASYNGERTPVDYGSPKQINATAWDADVVQGCLCYAPGYRNGSLQNMSAWTGYDCSRRECPTGDYAAQPYVTNANGTRVLKSFEEQVITCKATGGSLKLTFRDETTRAIEYNARVEDVAAELEALSSIGSVDVWGGQGNATGILCDWNANNVSVSFTSELGDVPLIVADGSLLDGPYELVVKEYRKGTKDDYVCSLHGECDYDTGTCDCFAPYTTSDANNAFGLRGDCGVALL